MDKLNTFTSFLQVVRMGLDVGISGRLKRHIQTEATSA
jgi:hypothetical protein